MHVTLPIRTLCIVGVGLIWAHAALADTEDGPAAATSQEPVMYLGQVQVRGELQITRTLQAIKVALTMPYSNDPKLANVMVCRLEEKASSHIEKELICGTNRTLALLRGAVQSNATAAVAQNNTPGIGGGCFNGSCYTAVFEQLNETLGSLPGHYLRATVDGSALRTALRKVPMPAPDASTAVAAPGSATKY